VRREVRADGREARTFYRMVERGERRSLVRLRLDTGRTHQIRVHMQAMGCPVAGDFLYGTELDELPGRFALHSAYLKVRHPITGVDESVMAALQTNFRISWTALLPAVVMFLLPLLKVPIKAAMGVSIAVAAVLAVAVQGFSLGEIVAFAWSGYHPADPALARVMSGGGVTSMTVSYVIVSLTGLCSGILDGTGALSPMKAKTEALAGRIGRFPAMIVVSTVCAGVLCNQAVTSMMGEQLLGSAYSDREELAMDIENSGILIAGLIPWSIACSVPLSMMGVDSRALLYAWLLWLIPICYLFTKRFFYPGDRPHSSAR